MRGATYHNISERYQTHEIHHWFRTQADIIKFMIKFMDWLHLGLLISGLKSVVFTKISEGQF